MALREAYASLKATGFGRIIFVLDASESAAPYQSAIISLLQEVLSALPARVERALYFLGNASSYSPHSFASRAARWCRENQRRASLVTPIWDGLGQDDRSTIVVIGSGRVFDLEDWAETPLARRVILVSMGDSLQGEAAMVEELMRPTASELLQRLHDPVTGAEVSGPGFLPTWWNNAGYQLRMAQGEASLVAGRIEDYTVALRFFVEHDAAVQAVMIHASGARSVEPLEAAAAEAPTEPSIGWLSPDEAKILHKAARKEPFTCLCCGEEHSWNALRCEERSIILGECIYPSLASRTAAGFVVFHVIETGVRFELHPGTALRLGFGDVAIKEGQSAKRYSYDVQGKCWVQARAPLEPYHTVGDRAYVVLV